jgi:dihydropteroate synthase
MYQRADLNQTFFGWRGDYGASIVLMHMQGQPRTMQINPQYKDVVQEVKQFLQSAIEIAMACGVKQRSDRH